MGKILPFEKRKKCAKDDKVAEKLVIIASEIDEIVLRHLQDDDIDPRDLVGLLSHRLGTLMKHIDRKSELWHVCQRVMKKQAQID